MRPQNQSSDLTELKIKHHYFKMKKIILQSGTYAVDDILQGFDIIEKPSSNVAFVGTCLITHQMYVQFKNGSGYMYSEVDFDTLSAVPAVDSIGKFISSQVVKKFANEKMEKPLIGILGIEEPVLIVKGDVARFGNYEAGKIYAVDSEATVEYLEPEPMEGDNEPEF